MLGYSALYWNVRFKMRETPHQTFTLSLPCSVEARGRESLLKTLRVKVEKDSSPCHGRSSSGHPIVPTCPLPLPHPQRFSLFASVSQELG